jgi:hypothetical protein
VVLETLEHSRIDKIKYIARQVQALLALLRSPRELATTSWLTKLCWLQLANYAFYLIGSAVFQCVDHNSKTKDFLFFVFQSVSRANTVNKVKMKVRLCISLV